MRVSPICSTVMAFAMAAVPLVSGAGQLGFALGTNIASGACKVQADYEADFDAIKKNAGSTIVRIYSAADCDVVAQILPAAKNKGFQVLLGVWPETDAAYNTAKAAIVNTAVNYIDQIHAITVGSESLYRKTQTAQQIVDRINDLRQAAPQFHYGTADSWNKYADGTADPIVPVADILLVNAFAYWQGAAIADAVTVFNDDISQAFARIQSTAGSKQIELWVGETGWPTEGDVYQNAMPSTPNAETFYTNGVCKMVSSGTNVFYFEAFDEPSKPNSVGENGQSANEQHWGAMTVDRVSKFNLMC